MSETQHSTTHKSKIQKLLRVALILSIVTAIEFVVAFLMQAGTIKTSVFVLTNYRKGFLHCGRIYASLL